MFVNVMSHCLVLKLLSKSLLFTQHCEIIIIITGKAPELYKAAFIQNIIERVYYVVYLV